MDIYVQKTEVSCSHCSLGWLCRNGAHLYETEDWKILMLTKCKPEDILHMMGVASSDNDAWHFMYDILREPLWDLFEEIQMYQKETIRRIYVKRVA